jgi:hypothetical protein
MAPGTSNKPSSIGSDPSSKDEEREGQCLCCKQRLSYSALGRTRTCDLLIRSHSPPQTGRYSGGQGETKPHFYQVLTLLEGQGGTGRDTRLRSDCGQKRV